MARPRLTPRILNGLTEMCAIAETVLETGGEGWGLECTAGADHTPCDKPKCEICRDFADCDAATRWLRHFIASKEKPKAQK